jgi:EVE domain-containing protein
MSERRYWIGVASSDHVETAVREGFVQLGHGKAGPLERLAPGDGFAYYSPRETYPGGPVLQAFTAIGKVAGNAMYEVNGASVERAFRRPVQYFDATAAPIKPLIDKLTFIRSKKHWGAAFRFGLVRIPEADFATVATAMGRDAREDFG